MAKGDLVRLVVLPGEGTNSRPGEQAHWWDTTWVDVTVRDADGQTWSLRGAALQPGGLDEEVWRVCEGDAPTYDADILTRGLVEEHRTADRKVRFFGTVGAVQVRGGKTTMSLGAAGEVQVGREKLSAAEPTSRTVGR